MNVSGVNPIRTWLGSIPKRVLIDTDPVFTQIRHLTDSRARNLALQHTNFYSFGENIRKRLSAIPDDHIPWLPTRQPVVLDAWPVKPGPADGKFTTVMQWDSYPPCEYNGNYYGMKSESFKQYMNFPQKTNAVLELALGGQTAPRQQLNQKGWTLCDPLKITRDPLTYQQYIQQSKAEFSVAKHGYIVGRSGWFSERSATYLASGRPVIVQDTGFSDWMETGAGVKAFKSPDEALAEIEDVNRRYEFHCRAARDIADEYFEAKRVLSLLLDNAMNESSF
jgi:hypothetical protein